MAKKIRFFLDSGANIHSCNYETYTLEELGIEEDEWSEMDEDDKYELAKDIMFQYLDYGLEEI